MKIAPLINLESASYLQALFLPYRFSILYSLSAMFL